MVQVSTPPLVSPAGIVASGLCIGCGSCAALATGAQMSMDCYGQLRPNGPKAWMRQPDQIFSRICPFSPLAQNEDALAAASFPAPQHQDQLVGRYEAAYVGHVAEGSYREAGSSGGMVTWVAAELLARGLVDGVAHVAAIEGPGKRRFRYRISRNAKDLVAGAKSRYYPVDLSEIVREISATPGRHAVVGVPCFIKAIQLLRAEDPVLRERIRYTLGLFCGHMKSARMIDSFAWQMGVDPDKIHALDFRLKTPQRPANWYTAHFTLKDGSTVSKDWWHLADGDWGAGFFQNSACNFCDDVVAETADISFGDAWIEPYSSDGRGTNVVIVRSPVLHEVVRQAIEVARICLEPVDGEFIVQTQAAGFRQRREGLSYRLSWRSAGAVRPVKRVAPQSRDVPFKRRLIYRLRAWISLWSHRMFWLARLTRRPGIYLHWARLAVTIYHGLAYLRGPLGRALARLWPQAPEHGE